MSSTSAPNYYFSGINFNSSYFVSSSSGLTIGQLNNFFISKKNADTASGLISFKGGLNTIASGNITTINTVYTDKIQPYYQGDSISLYTTGTGIITLGGASNTLNLATPICPQALTYTSPDQIGWCERVSFFTDTAYVGPGTYYTKTSQSLTVGTQLSPGTYLITLTGSTIIGSGVSGGTTTQAGAGYFLNNTSYGGASGVVITTNTTQATHPLLARTPGQYYWNFSLVVQNTLVNAYIYGHVFWTTSAAITGTVQNVIQTYSLTRIA